jgi:lysophospholipase
VFSGNVRVDVAHVIEDFAMQLRAGSHLVVVGSQHELLMEQDRYRTQFWAAFDAFVPGTPLF